MIGLIPYIIKALLGDYLKKSPGGSGHPSQTTLGGSTPMYKGYASGVSSFRESIKPTIQTTPKVYVPRGSTNIHISEFKPTPISPSTPTNNIRQFR